MSFAQAPHSVLMIRPKAFAYNPKTADSNAFQLNTEDDQSEVSRKALEEFNTMVALLESNDIRVLVFDDTASPAKPDVLFPNNWISLHEDGTVILYPMMAENRRAERRPDIIDQLKSDFNVTRVIDLSDEENNGRYLEGTGSLVFDNVNQIAYACRSPRTHDDLVNKVCGLIQYKPVIFNAADQKGKPVYHTNVVMFIGSKIAGICLDAIKAEQDQEIILESFSKTGHKVVAISYDQMHAFAGNMLEVKSKQGEPVILLSDAAFNSLLPGQIDALSRYADLIPTKIDTIERYGGGSVRCMVAGIYLPYRAGNSSKS